MSIIVFGGAFDPPHVMHMESAKKALRIAGATELWFMPTYKDSVNKCGLTTFKHRLAMLEIDINALHDDRYSICLEELYIENNYGTYVVMNSLKEKYPKNDFFFLIGLDQASNIRTWRNSKRLLSNFKFIVVERGKINKECRQNRWFMRTPHIFMDNNFASEEDKGVSSSSIRYYYKRFCEENSKSDFTFFTRPLGVSRAVHDYILKNSLYMEETN